jgi:hypothetical protein
MNHHSESYILYLRAQGMTEACNNLYHAMSRGESTSYYLKDIQEYLDMTQTLLNNLKIAAQKG